MSFPTPHSGWLLFLAGTALFLFAIVLLLQQPSRFVAVSAPPLGHIATDFVPFYKTIDDFEPIIRQEPGTQTTDLRRSSRLSPPECYEIQAEDWICAGLVTNFGEEPLYNPVVVLENASTHTPALKITPAMRMILPYSSVPYHAYISDYDENLAAFIHYASTVNVETMQSLYVSAIEIEQKSGAAGYARVQIQALLHNPHQFVIDDIRIVYYLLDQQGQLAGYRTFSSEKLLADEERLLTLSLVPWINDDNLQPFVLAEGIQTQ